MKNVVRGFAYCRQNSGHRLLIGVGTSTSGINGKTDAWLAAHGRHVVAHRRGARRLGELLLPRLRGRDRGLGLRAVLVVVLQGRAVDARLRRLRRRPDPVRQRVGRRVLDQLGGRQRPATTAGPSSTCGTSRGTTTRRSRSRRSTRNSGNQARQWQLIDLYGTTHWNDGMYFNGVMTQYGAVPAGGRVPVDRQHAAPGLRPAALVPAERRPHHPAGPRDHDRHELELVRERAMDRDTTTSDSAPVTERPHVPHAAGAARRWPRPSCSPRSGPRPPPAPLCSQPAPVPVEDNLQAQIDGMLASGMPADHPKVQLLQEQLDLLRAGADADTPAEPGVDVAAALESAEAEEATEDAGAAARAVAPAGDAATTAEPAWESGTVECEPVPGLLERRRGRRRRVRQRAPARRHQPLRGRRPGRHRALGRVRPRRGGQPGRRRVGRGGRARAGRRSRRRPTAT